MALLVEIRREDRIVNGDLVKVGKTCLLPNSLALVLERTGLCAWASGNEQVKHGAARSRSLKAAKERKAQKKAGNR